VGANDDGFDFRLSTFATQQWWVRRSETGQDEGSTGKKCLDGLNRDRHRVFSDDYDFKLFTGSFG